LGMPFFCFVSPRNMMFPGRFYVKKALRELVCFLCPSEAGHYYSGGLVLLTSARSRN